MVSGTILLNLKLLANCSTYFYMTPKILAVHSERVKFLGLSPGL